VISTAQVPPPKACTPVQIRGFSTSELDGPGSRRSQSRNRRRLALRWRRLPRRSRLHRTRLGRCDRLQGHNHRIGLVIQGSPGGGVHTHANHAPKQNIAGKASRPGTGNFLGQRDDLGLIPLLVDRHDNIGIALGLHDARRHAGSGNFQTRYLSGCARRRTRNGNVFGRPTRHRRAANARQRDRRGNKQSPRPNRPSRNLGMKASGPFTSNLILLTAQVPVITRSIAGTGPSLFKPNRGIVGQIDSPARNPASHMKKNVQAIEKAC